MSVPHETWSKWGNDFDQVSWGADKNCGSFTNGQFSNVSLFFPWTLDKNNLESKDKIQREIQILKAFVSQLERILDIW